MLRSICDKPGFAIAPEGNRTLALTALAAGEWDIAVAHFMRAYKYHQEIGAVTELAWDCYEYSNALFENGEHDQRDEARRLLGQGWRMARELKMPPLLDKINRLAAREGVELQKTTRTPAASSTMAQTLGLTKRELEVLRHIAMGQTNQEIAYDLHISEHTVANHVGHILDKIGVSNRIDAATFAVRHSLAGDS